MAPASDELNDFELALCGEKGGHIVLKSFTVSILNLYWVTWIDTAF